MTDVTPPDYTWPGFEALPEPLQNAHRRFFQALAQRNPLTLREYRRAFRSLYLFMQEQCLSDLKALTAQHLEAFQQWGYRRHHWTPGNMAGLVRTLRRIGHFLKRLGVLGESPFERMTLAQPQAPQQDLTPQQPLSWFRAVRGYFRWLRARDVNVGACGRYLQSFRHFYGYLVRSESLRPPAQVPAEQIRGFAEFLATHPVKSRKHPLAVLAPSMRRIALWRIRSFTRWLTREGFRQPEAPARTVRFQTAVVEFLAYGRMRMASGTQRQYIRSLRHFQAWLAQRPKGQRIHNIVDVTMGVVTDYQRWLNTQATQPDGSSLTQPEKEAQLYALKAFLRFCYRKGFLAQDLRPFVLVPRREHKIPKRLLTAEEMVQLLEAPSETTTVGIRDRAILELAYSGLRAGELFALQVTDIQLEENRVFIRQAKGEKDRVVPMTSAARYWLGRWLRRRAECCRKADPGTCFLSQHARPLSRRNFAITLLRHARRARLAVAIAPHDLRRITATHLAEAGAPLRFVQALLGHTSLKVTTRYLRLSDERIKREYTRSHPSNRRDHHVAVA